MGERSPVATEDIGSVRVVTLRQGRANAMDIELCRALSAALDEAGTQAVVLTGSGTIFSAGVDLHRVAAEGRAYLAQFLPLMSDTFLRLFSHPGPVVAAVNGHAIAGGCILAVAADHRVMAAGSGRIGVTELLVGVPFPAAPLEIMRFAVGEQRLGALVGSGATFEPEAALSRGLVDEVVPADRLLDVAVSHAERLASIPRAAFALVKSQLRAPARERLDRTGAALDEAAHAIWMREETIASIRAYVELTIGRSRG